MPADDILQLTTILIILILVMAAAYFTTRYITRFQQVKGSGSNIDIIETYRLSPTKYVQIIRLGETYVAIAVCKDTVTKLADLSADEVRRVSATTKEGSSFTDVLNRFRGKGQNDSE